MKILSKLLTVIGLTAIIVSSLSTTNAYVFSVDEEPFRPSDGISSSYTWNFTGFSEISVINSTEKFIDYANVTSDQFVFIDNPISGLINVTYQSHGPFLVEKITTLTKNSTFSFKMSGGMLINTTTREYVNEDGRGNSNYANSYIDPRNVSIGTKIMVSDFLMNVTAIETISVAGYTREAYKLIENEYSLNMTFFFDTITGILLKFDIVKSTDLNTLFKFKNLNGIQEESRELIFTNAFEGLKPNSQTTPATTDFMPLIVLPLTISIYSVIKKYRRSKL